MKRLILGLVAALAAFALLRIPVAAAPNGIGSARLQLVEATIADIQKAEQTGLATITQIVRMYLARIDAYDKQGPKLNAFLHVNELAIGAAQALDAARHPGISRTPIYGIPVLLKDNIDTADMPTTAGSVALTGSIPPQDAFLTAKLREAGAVILGKGTLTEFANFLTNCMPTGYSSLGGFGFNPYDPRPDPRTALDACGTQHLNDGRPALATGGSSSGPGIAVSANMVTLGVGTETSGSILSPSTQNLVVGIKPTVGLISRDGIVPITADQDTAGPMARTVTDAAVLLGVLAGFDPNDPATAACLTPGNCLSDYTQFLDPHALQGARIDVPKSYWPSPTTDQNKSIIAVMQNAVAVLQAQGADVEFTEIPTQAALNAFPGCGTHGQANCSTVLLYGFKRDLNAYLAAYGQNAPSHSLADVIAYNNAHPSVALRYGFTGQDLALESEKFDVSPGSADTARYQADRAKDLALARGGLDAIYNGPDGVAGTADDFDAILFPANRGANAPARAGFPSIAVPGGFVLNAPTSPPFPAGFNALPAPYDVTFSGRAFSEARLIALAYAFEQATRHRVPPPSTPPLPTDTLGRPAGR